MTILALETSCDETSAAIVRDGQILANTVSSQIKLHAEYGGVVPELAAREHLKNLLPVAHAALAEAKISVAEIDAVAATQGPGLAIALTVLALNLVGEGLSDGLNTRLDGRTR